MKNIVIIGGGAGGLELATRLGDKLGRKKKAKVTLVDRNLSHVWKPLLHRVATGALDENSEELNYYIHACNHFFHFYLGTMIEMNRERKTVLLDAIYDERGNIMLPARKIAYDILVIALGSISNDFGTIGVKEYCFFLDNFSQAQRLRNKLIHLFLKHTLQSIKEKVTIAVVGGGATGVELVAELHGSLIKDYSHKFTGLNSQSLNVTLIEAGERILPTLPIRISSYAYRELTKLGVRIITNTIVTRVDADGLYTQSGEYIRSEMTVWAAGIKAPDYMKDIANLETNQINQLVVSSTLQTTRDPYIFSIGDCASYISTGIVVPPRAQAAHQMASHTCVNILALLNNKPLKDYFYRDYGSLVSLSKFSTVGNLMGNVIRGSMMIEGCIARIIYVSLYQIHQISLHGYIKTVMMIVAQNICRMIRFCLRIN